MRRSSSDAGDEAAPKDAAKDDDIWADATPEQRAAHEAALQENKSHRGRASAEDRRRHADDLQAKKAIAERAAKEPATPETAEDYEQFKTEYPEVAGPVEARFARLEAENAELRSRVTNLDATQLSAAIDSEEALLEQRHPEWRTFTASKEFSDWLTEQPRYIQEGLARNGDAIVDGLEAASLLDMFTGPTNDPASETPTEGNPAPKGTGKNGIDSRRQRRLQSAVTTQGGKPGRFQSVNN